MSDWRPTGEPGAVLDIGLHRFPDGGSMIVPNRTGRVPGVRGHLNPSRDSLDCLYVYADNVAVNDGVQQPVHFCLGEPVKLTDALGTTVTVWFREVIGASSVLDYAPASQTSRGTSKRQH